jgi:eukaryotic-like serine/threonine-protein kinase
MVIGTLNEGSLFAGRYVLRHKLGTGGMADVWLAEDQELGRRVAVKVLHERYASDDQFVERFRREATHAAGLTHPNIVAIFDRGESEGTYYIVMEYVEGQTLKELIRSRGVCPVPVAVAYARQVLAALRYAHRAGIIHRDIKPHNVLVDGEGRIKVADFGIARAGASQMTEAGSIIGTAQYLSPEQARGAPVDESSDLYSTGVVLYELLTGEVPFTGETPVEIAMKHLQQPPAPPSKLRAEIPAGLDHVVVRSLAKEAAERFRSAEEMDRELERVARGDAVARETEEAATMVLAGAGVQSGEGAASPAAPPGNGGPGSGYAGSERYRAYDGPVTRERSVWPWLLALGVLLAAVAAGYVVYDRVQQRIDSSTPIPVENYEGIDEALAVTNIHRDGFEDRVRRVPNADNEAGKVFDQAPDPGTRLAKGSIVTITVSTGTPKVRVPNVVGKTQTDAIEILTRAGLDADPKQITSPTQAGTVLAQAPAPGEVVVENTRVRINISKGPKPIGVPSVVDYDYAAAESALQNARFSVRRQDVESNKPAGVVVAQDPVGNSTAAAGSVVVLSVSKGPKTVIVTDVTNSDYEAARATLIADGFKVTQQLQDVDEDTLNNIVLAMDPEGGTEAVPGTTVTLVVGRYTPPPTDTAPPDTTVDTTATDTTATTP